jgi:hypothetical protein
MSRRTGKAATRRARQQRRARQGPNPAAAAPRPVADETVADAPAPAPRPAPAPAWTTATTSRLGEGAREEYHYVMRDLRNTGLLVLVMTALLAGAVILVNVAGLTPS